MLGQIDTDFCSIEDIVNSLSEVKVKWNEFIFTPKVYIQRRISLFQLLQMIINSKNASQMNWIYAKIS